MSNASPDSVRTSAPTSTSKRSGESPLPGEAAAKAGSPAVDAYLREQAEEARAALTQGFNDLKVALSRGVDPRQLPRKFPFITVGAVAVTGFVAAVLTIPSKEQQELRRLERIRRAMSPDPEPVKDRGSDADRAAEKAAAKAGKPPLWVTLVREGVTAARPLLVSLVTASIKAKQNPEPPPPAAAPDDT